MNRIPVLAPTERLPLVAIVAALLLALAPEEAGAPDRPTPQ